MGSFILVYFFEFVSNLDDATLSHVYISLLFSQVLLHAASQLLHLGDDFISLIFHLLSQFLKIHLWLLVSVRLKLGDDLCILGFSFIRGNPGSD